MAVINITTTASGYGLKEELEDYAAIRGLKIRTFVGKIFEYSIDHKRKFDKLDKPARKKGGANIGAVVSDHVKSELTKWAKEKNTPRGLHCCFILEKAIDDEALLNEIFM